MNVLITSAGSTNGVNIIRALKGWVNIIATDCSEMSAGLYMSDVWFITPKSTEDRFISVIKDICDREKIDIIFPSHSEEIRKFIDEPELVNRMVISPKKVYDITENKVLCNAFIRNLGLLTPKEYTKEFPVIIKPIKGTGSRNVFKANNSKEFEVYYGKDMFYEEFIDGVEYTVDGVSDFNGKMVCALPRIRLEKRGGLATKCITEKNYELVDMVRKIVEGIGLVGVWNVQCIKRGNEYYFIDVNNRFPSGGMPLATASGMNIPLILMDILKGAKPTVNLIYGKRMLRYYDAVII
jgi:carbamoyl-phosphate synthase large subunit